MNVDFFYKHAPGRALLKLIEVAGGWKFAEMIIRSPLSKPAIAPYIRKNQIDMTRFQGQTYHSFAEFFARKCADTDFSPSPDVLISPCDGLLSIFPVTSKMNLRIKGSRYRMTDLIPDRETAELFRGGFCMIYRLQASDYHHFLAFDDFKIRETHYIKGRLHSVQPIACETVPVYRLNRRWWSVLETEHFGTAAQVEVGAMLVGGVTFAKEEGVLRRGDEMGNFELRGSTIALFFGADVRRRLRLESEFRSAAKEAEIPVKIGQPIGRLRCPGMSEEKQGPGTQGS